MRTRDKTLALAAACSMVTCSATLADGFLWLGSEFQGEGTIYRYNIDTAQIDRIIPVPRPSGVGHWNNMACDDNFVYLGSPTTQFLLRCDPDTGAVLDTTSYSPALAGHKEDGAYRPSTDTFFRMTFSGSLHEVNRDGTLVRSWSGTGNLVGAEWVGDTLYATNYSGGDFGVITFPTATTYTYTVIPFTSDTPALNETAGLAHDRNSGVLYMTANRHRLWRIELVGAQARSTLVADLSTLGYPSNGLIDGLGWWSPGSTCAADFNRDGFVNPDDLSDFITCFFLDVQFPGTCAAADFNGDGFRDPDDLSDFITSFFTSGC